MKYDNLTLLFLLLPLMPLNGQQATTQQDYLIYHQQIIAAETLISEQNFREALNQYDALFQSYDFVFLRDYKIAAQLAVSLNEQQSAFAYIKKGIAAGWEWKALKKNNYLNSLKGDPEWSTLEQAYPELRKQYFLSIDGKMREKVRQMFKKDQRKALGALFRIGDKAQERYALKKFAPHSEAQINQLIIILENQGYPGEQLIGNNYWMSTIISHHNSITKEYGQKDTLYPSIQPLLIEAIKSGQLSPYEYALIDDWYKAVSSNRTIPGYGFLNTPRQSTLEITNQLRQKIGLRTIELRNELVEVEDRTGMDFYLPDWVNGKIEVVDQ